MLLISCKYSTVYCLFCTHLVVLATVQSRKQAILMICVPNLAQQALPYFHIVHNKTHRGISSSLQLSRIYSYKWDQRNVTHGRKTKR